MQLKYSRSLVSLKRFLAEEGGTTAIEYALIASGISIAIATVAVSLGSTLRDDLYQKILDAYPS